MQHHCARQGENSCGKQGKKVKSKERKRVWAFVGQCGKRVRENNREAGKPEERNLA